MSKSLNFNSYDLSFATHIKDVSSRHFVIWSFDTNKIKWVYQNPKLSIKIMFELYWKLFIFCYRQICKSVWFYCLSVLFSLLFLKQISRSLSWPYSFLLYFFINKHSQAILRWVQNRFELWKSKTGTMLICNTCWLCFQGKHSQGFIAILFFKQTWSDC